MPLNNFLKTFLYFIVVGSSHDKKTRENKFQISLSHSSVAERRSFSTPPI